MISNRNIKSVTASKKETIKKTALTTKPIGAPPSKNITLEKQDKKTPTSRPLSTKITDTTDVKPRRTPVTTNTKSLTSQNTTNQTMTQNKTMSNSTLPKMNTPKQSTTKTTTTTAQNTQSSPTTKSKVAK